MPASSKRIVGDVVLDNRQPTRLSMSQLFNWIIWQFPRPRDGGYCSAVRPPQPDCGWLPAVVNAHQQRVHVYGHLESQFESPEAAAEYFSYKDSREKK